MGEEGGDPQQVDLIPLFSRMRVMVCDQFPAAEFLRCDILLN